MLWFTVALLMSHADHDISNTTDDGVTNNINVTHNNTTPTASNIGNTIDTSNACNNDNINNRHHGNTNAINNNDNMYNTNDYKT